MPRASLCEWKAWLSGNEICVRAADVHDACLNWRCLQEFFQLLVKELFEEVNSLQNLLGPENGCASVLSSLGRLLYLSSVCIQGKKLGQREGGGIGLSLHDSLSIQCNGGPQPCVAGQKYHHPSTSHSRGMRCSKCPNTGPKTSWVSEAVCSLHVW